MNRSDQSEPDEANDRGVSPVIGVILMVAITVILAAVIAAFVLDLGQSQGANAQAGIAFDQDGTDVVVTINSITRADSFTLQTTQGSSTACQLSSGGGTFSSVGDTATFDCSAGSADTIQVIGTYEGSDTLIADYPYEP